MLRCVHQLFAIFVCFSVLGSWRLCFWSFFTENSCHITNKGGSQAAGWVDGSNKHRTDVWDFLFPLFWHFIDRKHNRLIKNRTGRLTAIEDDRSLQPQIRGSSLYEFCSLKGFSLFINIQKTPAENQTIMNWWEKKTKPASHHPWPVVFQLIKAFSSVHLGVRKAQACQTTQQN